MSLKCCHWYVKGVVIQQWQWVLAIHLSGCCCWLRSKLKQVVRISTDDRTWLSLVALTLSDVGSGVNICGIFLHWKFQKIIGFLDISWSRWFLDFWIIPYSRRFLNFWVIPNFRRFLLSLLSWVVKEFENILLSVGGFGVCFVFCLNWQYPEFYLFAQWS